MKLVLGITTVLLLAVFSVAYLYFSNLTGDSRSNDKTLAAIPADAAIIFNFVNDRSLYEIFKDYTVFDTIAGNQKKQELKWLKNFILSYPELSSAAFGQKVFLSLHPLSTDSLQFLWVMPLREDIQLDEIADFLKKQTGQITKGAQTGSSILEINDDSVPGTFYIGIDGGIARGSFSKALLLESLDGKSKKISKEFVQEINDAVLKEDNALTSLFINHNKPGFLDVFFKEAPNGNFDLFKSSAAYTNLNLNYKSDAFMFNGVTRLDKGQDDYLNIFLEQEPVRNTIKKIIPYNLSNAICYGLSDYKLFNASLKDLFTKRKELAALDEQIKLITTETGVNPDRDIKRLWGNEFSNMQLSTYENLAVIRISNGQQLQFYLEPLSTFYSDAVRKMDYENLFYYYFGDPLMKYSKPFFGITDNLVIISNSPGTVQRFLNDYNSERLLSNNPSFTRFDQLVADQSNISFLMLFGNSESLLKSLLKKEYSPIFNKKEYGFKEFYGISYQLTSNKEHFFTNVYSGYKSSPTASADSLVNTKDINR